jgi:hypothetical protein
MGVIVGLSMNNTLRNIMLSATLSIVMLSVNISSAIMLTVLAPI